MRIFMRVHAYQAQTMNISGRKKGGQKSGEAKGAFAGFISL